MTQVERLVGVGRRIFDHDERRIIADGLNAEVGVGIDTLQLLDPRIGIDAEIEEALNDVELSHEGFVGDKPFANGLPEQFGILDRCLLHEGEHHEGEMPFELLAGRAQLNLLVCKFDIVE